LIENTWQRLVTGHPPEGQGISLTIDIELQSLAMDLLVEKTGAAILLDAGSGELYVIASQPSYDPNQIEETWHELIRDEDAPLFNRATQSLYQPGLSIAPFLFAEALAQGELTSEDKIKELTASVDVSGEQLSCCLTPPESAERTLENALRYGCPGPLQEVFVEAGWDSIHSAVASFGFTQDIDINLQTTRSVDFGEDPSDQELAQLVIGQGALRVSPVQMARAVAGLFAEKERGPLQLVKQIEVDDNRWTSKEPEGFRVPPSSSGVVNSLRDIYAAGTTDLYGLRAQALSGTEGELLAWYLGALRQSDRFWTIVVVLEGEPAQEAEGIGRQILSAAQKLNP
jgi:peptidoglycan glycosyltransferase